MNLSDHISVLIVDDHPVVRLSYKTIISEIFKNVSVIEVGEVDEAYHLLDNQYFNVAIIDLNLADKSGFSIIKRIRELNIDIKVIVISLYDDIETIWLTKKLKANAFISKTSDVNSFKKILLQSLSSNDFHTTDEISQKLNHLLSGDIEYFLKEFSLLTQKERLVFKLKLRNHKNNEIANVLNIKLKSVENYINRISDKCIPSNYNFNSFVDKYKVTLNFMVSFMDNNSTMS
jgi:DNA-binding NarL/FixJ family response regulator